MRRSATLASVGALSSTALLIGLTACNTDFVDDPIGGGAGGGVRSEPGQHSELPEPCAAPSHDRLSELLPGADPVALEGEPQVTYDSSRRFSCAWLHTGKDASYELSVDFHRVISYDPDVSDDDQAAMNFAELTDAHSATEEADDPDGDESEEGDSSDGPSSAESSPDGANSPAEPDRAEEPEDGAGTDGPGTDAVPTSRDLEGIGTAAHLNDRLTDQGTQRDITLIFHSSNVVVTIDYAKTVPDGAFPQGDAPEAEDGDPAAEATESSVGPLDSAVLQGRTEQLARQLADQFDT